MTEHKRPFLRKTEDTSMPAQSEAILWATIEKNDPVSIITSHIEHSKVSCCSLLGEYWPKEDSSVPIRVMKLDT